MASTLKGFILDDYETFQLFVLHHLKGLYVPGLSSILCLSMCGFLYGLDQNVYMLHYTQAFLVCVVPPPPGLSPPPCIYPNSSTWLQRWDVDKVGHWCDLSGCWGWE